MMFWIQRGRPQGISRFIPFPLKIFGGIAVFAAAGVFLTPAILILATPPLLCGWWLWKSRMMRMAKILNDNRWSQLASYHLQASNIASPGLDLISRSRILKALHSNEQDIARALRITNATKLSFGPLESLYQDFHGSGSGFAEQIEVKEYGLLADNRRVATVRTVSRHNKVRIELVVAGRMYVLEKDPDDGEVIDVK